MAGSASKSKQALGLLVIAALWGSSIFGLYAVFMQGKVYGRRMGWVPVGDHPVLTALTVIIDASFALAPIIFFALAALLRRRMPPRRGFSKFDIDHAKRDVR